MPTFLVRSSFVSPSMMRFYSNGLWNSQSKQPLDLGVDFRFRDCVIDLLHALDESMRLHRTSRRESSTSDSRMEFQTL